MKSLMPITPRPAFVLASLMLGAVTASAQKVVKPTTPVTAAKAPAKKLGPCLDFYEWANAEWLQQAEQTVKKNLQAMRVAAAKAPKGDSSSGTFVRPDTNFRLDTIHITSFGDVDKRIDADLTNLLVKAQKSVATTKDPLTRLLGNFYSSCLVAKPLWGTRKPEKDGGASRCLNAAKVSLDLPLGRAYVRDVLPAATKQRAGVILEQLRTAMEARIKANTWMSPATKEGALAKVASMRFSIGYPEREDDYSSLVLSPTDYDGNLKTILAFLHARETRNDSSHQGNGNFRQYSVNGEYVPSKNAVEIPMGILQPPFFDATKDIPENYAGIGLVIAHEITHGFDPQGAKYDAKGKYENWWVPSDTIAFNERTGKLADQYDQYRLHDTIPVNGRSTLNENVADLGLNIALDAYKLSHKSADNVAMDQRFFKGYAAIWRRYSTPEFDVSSVTQDAHAPGKWRVNGIISNMPAFAKAFGCKEGDPMVQSPEKRVEIW